MIAAGAVGSLALAAGFEYLANIPRSMASIYYPMTVRIWLSSLLLVLYVAGNFAYLRFALRKPSVSTWAAILVLVLGAAGTLYLPLWSLGLPGLSHLLSARWNPLTSAVSTGGLTSLLRLQFAVLLVLGLAVLSRNRHTAAPLPHSNAA
jgi:hypothetical protein